MDIILTGIARSGTTLACSLLNLLPRCVALHEPMHPSALAGLRFPSEFMKQVGDFFAEQRASLMATGTALSKGADGQVPENPFGEARDSLGLRKSVVTAQRVRFDKPLPTGFRLVVKHPNFFTATLETLQPSYRCYAIVRNPLAAVLSWHSISAPVNRGRLPSGEAFDPTLKAALDAEPDRLERQMVILRWYFGRYSALLPRERVIRYEDMVSTGGRALSVIDPDAGSLNVPLESRNRSPQYDPSIVRLLAERVISVEQEFSPFYSRSDIADLRDSWLRTAG